MKMQKKQFRIGQMSKIIGVDHFVIRFWEREFSLLSHRSEGGQRFYTEQDLVTFKQIKELLYSQGFTIAGAKQQLAQKPAKNLVGSHKTTMEPQKVLPASTHEKEPLITQCIELKKKLLMLRQLLS